MYLITLTSYGQSLVSTSVIIDGIILLYDYIDDISAVINISSYTKQLEEEACGNLKGTVGNLRIQDTSNNMYQARTLLFYKLDNNEKKIIGGYSQEDPIIQKGNQNLNLFVSLDMSAFTGGFLFSSIQAGFPTASHNSDGLVHIEDPNVDSDNTYSVYSKQQVDSLFLDYVTKDTTQTISGIKTFSSNIVGNLTGNASTSDTAKGLSDSTYTVSLNSTTHNFDANTGVKATSFIKSDGTSSQFLKADGSVDSNTYLTEHQDISGKQDVLTAGEGISLANDIVKTTGIPFGIVDDTSTSTDFTVTVPGIYKLEDGVCCVLKNGVITSAAGFTINVNGLGGKPVYSSLSADSQETTIFNVSYTMMFVYDSTRVSGGCWLCYRGYGSNTIGYQLRTNSTVLTATDRSRYYKIFFTSADNTQWVPASSSWTNSKTTAISVNQRPINPFGRIVYTSATTNYTAGSNVAAASIWDQYNISLGYSFNTSGGDLTLTTKKPVYVKCAPQSNLSAIIDSTTPIVQDLPTSADGKIYILLGVATSASQIELIINHPIYYHDGSCIRLWYGKDCYSKTEIDTLLSSYVPTTRTVNNKALSSDITLTLDDVADGTNRSIPTVNNATLTIKKNSSDTGSTFTANASTDVTCNLGLSTVATSGSYTDLSNKPTIPTVNNATLTIKKNTSDTGATFTANASTDVSVNLGLKEGAFVDVDETTMTASSTNLPSSKAVASYISGLGYITTETDPTVPSWAKESSKPSYTLDEVSDGSTRKLSNYVPTTRTVNSKALSSNITLSLDDVADGTNRKIPTNTNELTNGAGFITSSDLPTNHVTTDTNQTISGTKTFSSNIIGNLTGNASTSDTAKGLSDSTYTVSLNSTTHNFDANTGIKASSFVKTGGTSSQFLKADGSVDSNTYLTSHQSLAGVVASAQYNSTDKTIEFYNSSGTKLNTDIDATDFIKDGMVSNVEVTGGNLVISFNTDAGKEDIEIPITDIFDASNYYTKNDIDTGDYENVIDGVQVNGTDLTPDSSTKKVNVQIKTLHNKSLTGTGNVTLNLDDVSDGSTRKLSDYVPTTRTVNSKSLSSNITLTLDDVADGTSRSIPTVNNATLTINKGGTDDTGSKTFSANASSNVTINLGLSTVASSGSYNDLSNKPSIPTVNDSTITIQKNGTTVDSFTTNASSDKSINITVPTKTSDLTNDSGFLTEHQDISGKQDVLTAGEGITLANDIVKTTGIPFGVVDSTSTSTVFTVTVPGIYKLEDGVCCMVKNGVVTSASGFTLNVNGLGAKPCFTNLAAATQDSTIFNVNYTMLFVYDSTRTDGGGWICYRGYYQSDTDKIGYQLRTNSTVMTASDTARYYKIYFTSANGTQWVPASVNSKNDTTTARAVNQRPIDPFGRIAYTSASTSYAANKDVAATTLWSRYTLSLGYSFNVSGGDLTLTTKTPVYVKCAPQADGSAIMDSTTPIVQSLPNSNDGKIYIFLGIAYSATAIELYDIHPVYYHDGTGVRIWCGKSFATVATSGSYNDLSNKPTIPTVNDSTITIKSNTDDTGDSFTTNASNGKTINLGLSSVAISGSYNDLSNKPTIPTVNNASLTIKKNDSDTGTTFTANASTDVTCNLGLATVATSGSYTDLSNKPTNLVTTDTDQTITGAKTISESNLLIGSDTIKHFTLKHGQEFIIGTQNSSTYNWTGTTIQEALYDGMCINYYLPYASNASNYATLNLTLPNNSTTGAINIYYRGNNRVSTQFPVGSIIQLTYVVNKTLGTNTITGWLADSFYIDGNTINYTDITFNARIKADTAGIYNKRLVMRTGDGLYESITIISNDNTVCNPHGFYLDEMFYYDYASAGSSNVVTSGNLTYEGVVYTQKEIRLYNSLVSENTISLTVGLPLFLVGTYTDGKFYLDTTTWWTQTLPSSYDGKFYWYVGQVRDDSYAYILPTHPVFYYRNGRIRQLGVDDVIEKTYYGTCSTSAATQIKDVTCEGFGLITGSRVAVKFTNINSASSPKLRVNTSGTNGTAKPIIYRGTYPVSNISDFYRWQSGSIIEFVYDGTNWVWVGFQEYVKYSDFSNNTYYLCGSDGDGLYGDWYILEDESEVPVFVSDNSIIPMSSGDYDLGKPNNRWDNVYALTFNGDLSGNATTASSALSAQGLSKSVSNTSYTLSLNANNCWQPSTAIETTSQVGPYAYCETGASTAKKEITISNFQFRAGTRILVKFKYANTANNATLCIHNGVNDTTGTTYYLMCEGTHPVGCISYSREYTSWSDGQVVELVFDGTQWLWQGFNFYALQSLSAEEADSAISATYAKLLSDTNSNTTYSLSLSTSTSVGWASSTNILPKTTNTHSLGSSTLKWKNLYISGGNSNYSIIIDNNGGEPTIRSSNTNYGYLGSPDYHWYRSYINNIYASNIYASSIDTNNINIVFLEVTFYANNGDFTTRYVEKGTEISLSSHTGLVSLNYANVHFYTDPTYGRSAYDVWYDSGSTPTGTFILLGRIAYRLDGGRRSFIVPALQKY